MEWANFNETRICMCKQAGACELGKGMYLSRPGADLW